MVADQSTPGLNRGLLTNFFCENIVKFTEECELWTEKDAFVKMFYTNMLNMGLPR